MGNWTAMFHSVGKKWWTLMSCAALTFLGAIIAHFSLPMRLAEYLLASLCFVFLFLAFAFEWIDEHTRFLAAEQVHMEKIFTHEATAADLRATVNHTQSSLDQRSTELARVRVKLEKEINTNRPEVFATYSEDLIFSAMDVDSWNLSLRFHYTPGISVSNCGQSVAYDITIESIVATDFFISFSTLPSLAAGAEGKVEVFIENPKLVFTEKLNATISVMNFVDGGGSFSYEAKKSPAGILTLVVSAGMHLNTQWRDSSNNHFSALSKTGTFSDGLIMGTQMMPVKHLPTPMTEEEMQEAYDQAGEYS